MCVCVSGCEAVEDSLCESSLLVSVGLLLVEPQTHNRRSRDFTGTTVFVLLRLLSMQQVDKLILYFALLFLVYSSLNFP